MSLMRLKLYYIMFWFDYFFFLEVVSFSLNLSNIEFKLEKPNVAPQFAEMLFLGFQQLLREIEEYRTNLDRVNMKGRRLIDNNPKTPRLAQQMQSQLQNLEESFVNLQATAEQIRVSCLP